MASKNSNSAASNESGGFKTVAFGFDKNDVTMYIASLRKKMKAMEDEFEEKLAKALENPTASTDAMNHQKEIIRAEIEKKWEEKFNNRNEIIKEQQKQIAELESALEESNENVQSLQAQLNAATEGGDADVKAEIRAAMAYVQFTSEMHNIIETGQKALNKMESAWGGVFGELAQSNEQASVQAPQPVQSAAAREAAPVAKVEAVSAPKPAPKAKQDAVSAAKPEKSPEPKPAPEAKRVEPKPAPKPEPAPVRKPIDDFSDLLEEEPAPAKPKARPLNNISSEFDSLLADDSEDTAQSAAVNAPKLDVSLADFGDLLAEEPPAPKPKSSKAPAFGVSDKDLSEFLADEPLNTPAAPSGVKTEIVDDFDALIAKPNEDKNFRVTENDPNNKGYDLDTDLLSDIVYDEEAAQKADLGEMLKEQHNNELKKLEGVVVTAADPAEDGRDIIKAQNGDAFDFELKVDEAPVDDGRFDLTVDEEEYDNGKFDLSASTEENAVTEIKADKKGKEPPKNKQEDMFNFSFEPDSDDEDDMSDGGFPGLI